MVLLSVLPCCAALLPSEYGAAGAGKDIVVLPILIKQKQEEDVTKSRSQVFLWHRVEKSTDLCRTEKGTPRSSPLSLQTLLPRKCSQ